MADLQKGYTFVNGIAAQDSDMNNAVDLATILPAFISGKTNAAIVAADSLCYFQQGSTTLKKCTITQLIAAFPADAAAGTASLRTLGSASTQAAAGNDSRFSANVTGLRLSAGGGSTDTAAAPKDLAFAPTNLSGGTAINWDLSDFFYDTLSGSGNKTYTFSNVRAGRTVTICLNTSGWSGTTISWPSLLGTVPLAVAGSTVLIYTFLNTALGTSGIVKAL